MIKIHASLGNDEAFCLSAEGHAGAGRNEYDHDLVCCAVSTLMGTLANSCALIDGVNTVYHSTKGNALVTVTNITDDIWPEIASRFRMAMDGLQGLAIQYPNSLKVTEK